MKTCSRCEEPKPLEEFYVHRVSSDGRYSSCKTCEREKDKKRRNANPDLRRRQSKQWRANNRERHRSYSRRYRKEHRKEQNKKSRERWGDRERIYHRNYTKRDYVKARIGDYEKDRRRNDPEFVIKQRLRSRLLGSVKKVEAKKADKTIGLLGCSFSEFKTYFSSLFVEGMTWERFLIGEIHIDHIKPCSSFDLTDAAQQHACFHYTNLQPLWKPDNLAKGDRLDWAPSSLSTRG